MSNSKMKDLGLPRPVLAGLGALLATSVVARFFVGTSLWLDEALSVNIAELPIGDIGEALKQDGHPPLYYVLLHFWMEIFGTGDKAVRSLSAVISIVALVAVFYLGKRLGGERLGATAAMVFGLSAFAFRYGSETRMYSLLTLEVILGYLLYERAKDKWTPLTGVGVAAVTSALLWTHYWSFWLLGAAGLLLIARLIRNLRSGDETQGERSVFASTEVKLMASMFVGGITFLPWLPTLLYQNAHTGTPWAPGFRPATLVVTSLVEFAGGPFSEAQIMMLVMVVILAIGLVGTAIDSDSLRLDYALRKDAVTPLALLATVAVVASAVGIATGIAFAARYASVYFPFFVILLALGLDRFVAGRARTAVFVVFGALSVAGLFLTFTDVRSQSKEVAEAVLDGTDSGLIVVCPDQLGPATERLLGDEDGYDIVSYPDLDDPRFVDWVDYAEQNARNEPGEVTIDITELAGDRTIIFVWSDGYLTLEGQCPSVMSALRQNYTEQVLVTADQEEFYEAFSVSTFTPK